MKLFIPLALCILFLCSCSRDTRNKDQLVDAIVKAQGLDELARTTKANAVAESKEAAHLSYEEMKKSMPGASEIFLAKIKAASDQYSISVYEAWSVDESMNVWKQTYSADFTEAELRKMLVHIESEFGKKELAAAKRATEAWRKFITDHSRAAAEKAMAEYSATMQRIISEENEKKQ